MKRFTGTNTPAIPTKQPAVPTKSLLQGCKYVPSYATDLRARFFGQQLPLIK